jgi:hypothetical protein
MGYGHLQEITTLMLATTTLSATRTADGVGIVQTMWTSEFLPTCMTTGNQLGIFQLALFYFTGIFHTDDYIHQYECW